MISKISTYVTALVLVSSIFASDQRIASLGGNAGFWAEDDQNLYMFPATMHNFNLAQIQGVNGDESKATFLFGEGTKYGFMMDQASNNLINFAYGSGSWGLIFGFDTNSEDDGTTKSSDSKISANFGMNAGFGELGLSFATRSEDDGTDADDPKGLELGFNLRREMKLWEFSHMLLSFANTSGELGSVKNSSMGLNLDFFRHWTLNESTDLLFSLGFVYASTSNEDGTTKTETSQIWLPNYTFAAETNLLEWATIRAGVNNHHVLSSSSKTGDTETKESGQSQFTLFFGLGLEYGGFKLDIDLKPDFFTNPVSYITGFNDVAPATMATITYTW